MSDVHDTAGDRLRSAHQRYTRGRRMIVTALAEAGDPLSINELLERCTGLAQSSAYRNLTVLERAEVVRRLSGRDDFARYELAEHLTEHHHHLVCERCGRVTDFTMTDRLEIDLDAYLRGVATQNEFEAVGHQLDLVGTCALCRN